MKIITAKRIARPWHAEQEYNPRKRYAWEIKYEEKRWLKGGTKGNKKWDLVFIANEEELARAVKREFGPHLAKAVVFQP